MNWKPIETAPEEQRVLIFIKSKGVMSATLTEPANLDGIKLWCVDDDKYGPYAIRGFIGNELTHWMPLPDPPKPAGDSGTTEDGR